MLKVKGMVLSISILSALSLPLSLYANVGSNENTNATTGSNINTGTKTSDETTSQYMKGTAITANVKAQLLADPDIKSLNISVKTEKGVVTLSGHVDSKAQIDKAVSIASKADGVQSVNNRLKIRAKTQ